MLSAVNSGGECSYEQMNSFCAFLWGLLGASRIVRGLLGALQGFLWCWLCLGKDNFQQALIAPSSHSWSESALSFFFSSWLLVGENQAFFQQVLWRSLFSCWPQSTAPRCSSWLRSGPEREWLVLLQHPEDAKKLHLPTVLKGVLGVCANQSGKWRFPWWQMQKLVTSGLWRKAPAPPAAQQF